MGLCKYSKLNWYWSTNRLLQNQVCKVMSRNRFELLMRMLHFADDNDRQPNDRLYKISAILSIITSSFQNAYVSGEHACIDESNIPWRGRLIFRQYLPMKLHPYGIKVFKLCVAGGYTHGYKVYTGRDLERTGSVVDSVEFHLMAPLLDSGRCLFTDNWYTSVNLAVKLLMRNTHLVGTLRSNRKNNAPDVVGAKLKRGEVKAQQSDNGVTLCKWRDKRDVLVLSTCHKDSMVEVTRRHGEPVMKPEIIVSYNKSKAFIDLSDQMNSYSPSLRRTLKWYRRLILDVMLGTCMVNAFVMYTSNANNPRNKLSVTDFRHKIAEELLYPTQEAPPVAQPVVGEHRLEQVEGAYQKVKRRCSGCYERLKRDHNRKHASSHAKKVVNSQL